LPYSQSLSHFEICPPKSQNHLQGRSPDLGYVTRWRAKAAKRVTRHSPLTGAPEPSEQWAVRLRWYLTIYRCGGSARISLASRLSRGVSRQAPLRVDSKLDLNALFLKLMLKNTVALARGDHRFRNR